MKDSRLSYFGMLKAAFSDWSEDKAPRLGAALAYYTVFSISPLLVIVLAIAGLVFDAEAAQSQLFGELQSLLGKQGAEAVQSTLAAAHKPTQGVVATVIAAVTLFFGATGLFVELQDALNTVWEVPTRKSAGIWDFVKTRLLSFAMILGIGFLLLVSLIMSAGLAAVGDYLHGGISEVTLLWQGINFLVSVGVITVLFAMIFKFMPDVKIAWKDVWFGAFLTSLLFNVGKILIGLYLAKSTVASAYGAAGSVVILLLWVYYSAQILFLGAEFTQIYARQRGSLKDHATQPAFQETRPHKGAERARASAQAKRRGERAVMPESAPLLGTVGPRVQVKDLVISGMIAAAYFTVGRRKHSA